MSNLVKSTVYGGICAQDQNEVNREKSHINTTKSEESGGKAKIDWEKAKKLSNILIKSLRKHVWEKQDLYLPVSIALILVALVLFSKTAFSKTLDSANNLPVTDTYGVKMIGYDQEDSQPGKICSASDSSGSQNTEGKKEEEKADLKNDVASIVGNTPMSDMVDAISEKSRPVAAFIVGIAMKESKFGVYSPKKNGRDCYNYWGFKGGGTTVAGGYSCFVSPEQAIERVGGKIEKLVNRGVKSPAQMISWKCGSSCAGHGEANVRKWISDVAINFYKINS